jgi:hypothetical protein
MNPVINFTKCLAVMALSLTEKDVLPLKAQFTQWVSASQPFLKKFGILRDFTTITNNFIRSRMEFTVNDGADASARLKEAVADFQADTSISQEQLAMIKDCLLYYRKDSEPAWNRITRNIYAVTGDSKLATNFVPDDEEVEAAVGDKATEGGMIKLVLQLTGRRNDPILTLNEMRDFRELPGKVKLVERYSELRKVFVANYKKYLFKFIRSSGKPFIDVKIVRKYLDTLGCNYIPRGFIGSIDEQGRLYTTAGKQIAGMLIGEVKMNPKYDPLTDNTYVCSLVGNVAQRLRTVAFTSGNKAARFDKVSSFMKEVDKFRTKWVKDLDSLDTRTQVLAALVEAIYQTQARIGGDSKNMEGEDRYGMSTLLVKQLLPISKGFEFKYTGKKGTEQHHILLGTTATNRKVIAIIRELIKGKKPTDVVFTNRSKPLGAAPVNAYLKSLGVPTGITIHKFRHLAGTKLALKILSGAPFKKSEHPSQASVEKWIKEEMKQVGEMLHHRVGSGENQKLTGMTAINAYISPNVLKEFFDNLGLRVPKWIPKI